MDDTELLEDEGNPGLELPGFIALETGEGDLPVAIAWSLPDGRIKQTLIQPDPRWREDEALSLGAYSEDELNTLGVSGVDVMRELEADYHGETLYTAGVLDDAQALANLFEAFGATLFVELAPAAALYPGQPAAEWHEQRSELFSELGLEPLRAEHELQVMLMLHLRLREDFPATGADDRDSAVDDEEEAGW